MTVKLVWHGDQTPAVVRGKRLHRHRALFDEERGVAVVLLAQGPTRAWQRSLEAAVLGVSESLDCAGKAEEVLAGAARRVRAAASALVDTSAVQVHALALVAREDGSVEVAHAGSCRAYLRRGDEHRRLSSKAHSKGLADGFAFSCSADRLRPGDLVVAGPSHLFSVNGIAALARTLHGREPDRTRRAVHGLLSTGQSLESGGAAIALEAL